MQRPVRDVLNAVADELAALAQTALKLQSELSPLAYSGADLDTVQSLDLLTQALACLAAFTSQVGNSVPCVTLVELEGAHGCISLGELSRRLAGLARSDDPEAVDELFE